MAAPALDVDREAVKAHVLTYGVREAARAFNLSPATVGAWSARGKWLAEAHAALAPLQARLQTRAAVVPKSMGVIANTANSASVAARNSLAEQGKRTRLNLSRAALKGSIAAARMDGPEVIEQAQGIKAVTQIAAQVHSWEQKGQQVPLVSLNFHGSAPVLDAVEIRPSTE